ncbi:PKD domain-containing protein, partial [Candidatus Aminicenantes bacterium AH-873-B07]|nr:PKD domain-containing protein [Candidatus Aminicenantes bacterium AH-873-B07]
MKFIKLFFLTIISFTFLLSNEIVNISKSPNWDSFYPRIAVGENGNIYIVWIERYSEKKGDLFYSYLDYSTGEWSEPLNLSNNSRAYSETYMSCDVDVDESNRVYVVWVEDELIKLRIFSNGEWGKSIQIARSSIGLDCPRIAISKEGDIFIVWYSVGGVVYSKARINGVWEEIRRLSASGKRSKFPDIAVGEGVVYACWVEKTGDIYQAVYSKRGRNFNSYWSSIKKIYSSDLSHQHPIIEIDSKDFPHVIWTSYMGGPRVVHYSHWTGTNFTSPEEISSVKLLHYPSLYERNDNLYACWQVGPYENGIAIYYNVCREGEWDGEKTVPNSSGSTFSDVSTSPDEKLIYFTWDSKGEIYFCSIEGEPAPNIPPVADFTFSPKTGIFPLKVKFDASLSYDPDGKIVQYDWDFGDNSIGSGKIVYHTYQTWGTFSVTLSVKDDAGEISSKTKKIKVLRLFQPLNIRWQTFKDESLFLTRYITDIYWEKNPKNDEIANIVLYR